MPILEERKNFGSRTDVKNIFERCKDIVPQDDVFARDIVIIAFKVEDFRG